MRTFCQLVFWTYVSVAVCLGAWIGVGGALGLYVLVVAAYPRHVLRLWRRYYLVRTPWLSIYLHRLLGPDASQDLHNHPWSWSRSLVLSGGYLEAIQAPAGAWMDPQYYAWFGPGDVNVINRKFHRIADVRDNTWTLLLAGRRAYSWGFRTPDGFVDHRKYQAPE
jgi:hypothetical protein